MESSSQSERVTTDGSNDEVSEWMINGNINEFVKAHRDANRFELVGSYPYRRPRPSLM